MSDDELLRFCAANENLRVEREPNGEILVMTPAGWNTSKMNQRIGRLLDEWAEMDGRGFVTDSNGGYSLPDGSMCAPDAAWVARWKVEALTAEQRAGFAPICPDFIIELRSPSDKLKDLQTKMEQWIANGAEVAWLIDPVDKAVTIYRPGDQPAILTHPTSVQGTGPIAGFELVLSRIWN
ncbi:MAG TPA: Uma2 family endonuclease [Acidobacteriaceae bacterium]